MFPKCTGENDIKYLYCQREYSLISLRQQILQFSKQSYEKRKQLNIQYNLTATNQVSLPSEELATMSQYFFYVQSMRDKQVNMSCDYKDVILEEIFDGQKRLDSTVKGIFVAGVIFGVLSLLFGLFAVNYMKKLYFKEIIIVSFLNNEMISKNKRVESFLETLSKSSYWLNFDIVDFLIFDFDYFLVSIFAFISY